MTFNYLLTISSDEENTSSLPVKNTGDATRIRYGLHSDAPHRNMPTVTLQPLLRVIACSHRLLVFYLMLLLCSPPPCSRVGNSKTSIGVNVRAGWLFVSLLVINQWQRAGQAYRENINGCSVIAALLFAVYWDAAGRGRGETGWWRGGQLHYKEVVGGGRPAEARGKGLTSWNLHPVTCPKYVDAAERRAGGESKIRGNDQL